MTEPTEEEWAEADRLKEEMLLQDDDEMRAAAAARATEEGWEYNPETGEYVDQKGTVRDRYGDP